jgi:hypothetical protein
MQTSPRASAFINLILSAVTAGAIGCGSNSHPEGTPDASAGGHDAAIDDRDASVSEANPAIDNAPAGIPIAGYCTNKPAIPTVTNISGTWVIRALATQQVSVLGTILHPQTLFYMLTTMTQSGDKVTASGYYCDRAEIDQPGSLVTVIVPDKWAHTEKVVNRSGTLAVGAGGVPLLNFAPLVELAGAIPGPGTDAVPTALDDPRIIDEDQDDHPGITINVTGMATGSLYSVQRQVTSIAAIPVAADRFEGTLTFGSEQKVLDSNPIGLTALYATAQASTDPTPCASTFAMVKVAEAPAAIDAGPAVSCAWVRQNEAILFPK